MEKIKKGNEKQITTVHSVFMSQGTELRQPQKRHPSWGHVNL